MSNTWKDAPDARKARQTERVVQAKAVRRPSRSTLNAEAVAASLRDDVIITIDNDNIYASMGSN